MSVQSEQLAQPRSTFRRVAGVGFLSRQFRRQRAEADLVSLRAQLTELQAGGDRTAALEAERARLAEDHAALGSQHDKLVIERAQGSRLFDADGRSYIDGNASWWTSLLGHNHPRLVRALTEQASRLCHIALGGMTHGPAARFAEALVRVAPSGLEHVFFSDNGSTAVESAIKLCAQSNAALPDMGLLILRSRSRDEADLQSVADAAALAVMPKLTRRLQYLPMLANVATLLGLFGTIYGLREAFASVASASAAERSAKLAAGIAIALNATGFGLLVAIPLSIAHAYLVSQSEGIIEQVDEFSVRLVNALIDRPDVRLGHR